MRFLVTGGYGFIGVNLSKKLLECGHEVIVFDNLSRPKVSNNVSWLEAMFASRYRFVYGDVRSDYDLLLELAEDVDFIFHLAAQVAVTTSCDRPMLDFEVNALGTLNVLEAVRNSNRRPAVIFSSTNKVYGELDLPGLVQGNTRYHADESFCGVPEDQALDFHSPYGCSKGCADQYCLDYARIFGLRTVVVRQSCIYGINQFGMEDQGWISWFSIAAELGKPITIFGDGKQVRDILYVDDLVAFFLLVCDQIDEVAGEAFNIGGGPANTLSLVELMSLLEKGLGRQIARVHEDARPGDQKVYVSDISKASRFLGWTPNIDPERGIALLGEWVRSNLGKFD